jgi:glycosyltransferase involved in cell wall biosynthesis
MTIAVDCRLINASGVGVYLQGILPYFVQTENDFLLIGNPNQLQLYVKKNVTIIPCDIKPFSVKELFFFPKKTLRKLNKVDLFYSPFFNIPPVNIPVLTTIHDIIFPDMPELTSKLGLVMRMFFYRRAYKKSQKIFTVSEFSKSRIEFYLGIKKPIIVASGGIQLNFLGYRNNIANVKKNNTIVFIGNIKKHKGLNYLLDAFFNARKDGLMHKLIIVGSKDDFRTVDNTLINKINTFDTDSVSFTGFISDEQLMNCLSEASLLVQPSLYEGFGFPPLEAMVLGTHALISDIPVFKEIYGDFPVTFFRTGDAVDLKEKMMLLLNQKTPSSTVLTDKLLSKYTFDKTASIILKELV